MKKEARLTPKQEKFIQEYLNPNGGGYLNATQAAALAGYSKKTANEQGARLLANVSIKNAISKVQSKTANKVDISKERWIAELARIFFADMKDFVDVDTDTGATRVKGYDEMPKGASKVISSIEENRTIKEDSSGNDSIIFAKFKFKLHDKLKAGEMLGEHLGYLKKKVELSGKLDLVELGYEQAREVEKELEKGNVPDSK